MDAEQILSKLIAINSVFNNEKEIGIYLESHLKGLGLKTNRQYISQDRFNIMAERPGAGSAILFYAHMDTVTPHGKWKGDPFHALKEGDKMYGLGACDMKGGISAILSSLSKNKDCRVKLLFCSDEENISKGAWSAVKRASWFKDVTFMVSCEPGDSTRHTGGANVVTIGRRGRVVIDIDVYGLSSHGANPQRGINAIDEAAKIVSAANTFKLRYHPNLGKETIFVRKIEGSSDSALDLPDKAHLEFDIQLVPPSTTKDVLSRIESAIGRLREKGRLNPLTKVVVNVRKRETPYIEPYVGDLKDSKISKVLDLIRENIREPFINYGSSVADDNILSNVIRKPIVTIGPTGGNEHAQNEWVSRKSLKELVKVYGLILENV
ncbi:MAG: M20 family metallopeptidase [Candidatus Micrarchaeaceae archaeon]